MQKSRSARPILVAVRTLERSARGLLRKAASLAKLYGAPLRIVHVLAIPQGALARAGATVRQAAQADLEGRTARLEKLATLAELRGLDVTTAVRCDYPVQDALVREALACHARMLIAESHGQGRFARLFLTNIDWDLIRNCPCPLWLSKSERLDRRAPVIAAVDPMHTHAKPARLDDIILAHAVEIAGKAGAKVIPCHAYEFPDAAIFATPEAYWLAMSREDQLTYKEHVERALARLLKKRAIPSEDAVIVRGDPAFQLPRVVKKHRAGVVVMGAISRRGLKRVFIGNTAERVLDRLGCDVLIVKPRGFKSPVERQTYRHPVLRQHGHSLDNWAMASLMSRSGG